MYVWCNIHMLTFPPPNLHSSPYTVKSFSTLTHKSVSARRKTSPTVGPNMRT